MKELYVELANLRTLIAQVSTINKNSTVNYVAAITSDQAY